MIHVVLGMHKSGTTLISECLHHSGIEMVESADADKGYDNGQKWEREATKAINHRLLESSGQNSLAVDATAIRSTFPSLESEMRRTISDLSARSPDWGFKDPRTCLTYEAWAAVLPRHRVVAVYRDPMTVLAHYRRRQAFIDQRPLDVKWVVDRWCDHNQRLADIVQTCGMDSIVLSYDDFMRDEREFSRLEAFLGRPLSDMRKPELVRSRISGLRARMECWRLGGLRPGSVVRRLDKLRARR